MDRFDNLLSKLRKCCEKYGMINEGAKVLCAVSGGKDSLALAAGMQALSRFYPKRFTVSALTVDMGFEGVDFSGVTAFLNGRGIGYTVIKTDISKAVAELDRPCSLCARMRRAAICSYASENGYDTVALGHTEDDAAETALMNLLYGGKFETLDPCFEYEDKGVRIIRPLLMTNERLIIKLAAELDFPIRKITCGKENDSARDEVRKIISGADRTCRGAAHRIASAVYDGKDGKN